MNLRIFAVLLVVAGVAHAGTSGISKINGLIVVPAGESVGDVSTVNGAIRVTDRAVIGQARTVNGRITLGTAVTAQSLSTVNGAIVIGPSGRVAGTIRTTNGAITVGSGEHVEGSVRATNGAIVLDSSADVAGRLANVNGGVRLDAAHVGMGIEIVSGNIDVGARSRVEGGIWVRKSCTNEIWKWLFLSPCEPSRIVIGPNAVVQGTLKFEHAVKLYVSTSARIGPIEGAKAIPYSGTSPQT